MFRLEGWHRNHFRAPLDVQDTEHLPAEPMNDRLLDQTSRRSSDAETRNAVPG